jgi:hypothetical protein
MPASLPCQDFILIADPTMNTPVEWLTGHLLTGRKMKQYEA